MYVDASALVAVLSGEREAERVAQALLAAPVRITSAVAVLETALALARTDKFDLALDRVEPLVLEFLDSRDIELRDLSPARETARLALAAAHRFRSGRRGLNLGDCLHYACAKFYQVPILATDGEFGRTDLATAP